MDINKEKIEALKFLTNRYAENVWKHTSIHLVALGWIVSSKEIHNLIEKQIIIQITLTFIFLTLESIHWFVNKPIYQKIKFLESDISNNYD